MEPLELINTLPTEAVDLVLEEVFPGYLAFIAKIRRFHGPRL